ncbi:MAG: hypothetical protein V4508_10470 [Pseudomonadota bacterium]
MSRLPLEDQGAELAARKAALLCQAEQHRIGIVHARVVLVQALRPQALLQRGFDHVTGALPLAFSAIGLLRRRGWTRPALGVAAAAAMLLVYARLRHASSSPS